MSYWMRSGTIQAGPFKYSLDELAYKFKVPFEDSEQLMKTKVEIYNLSESTRNSIQKNHPVILNAGYEGDIGAVFTGKVSACRSKHQGTEWITTIEATDTMAEWLTSKVNKTYAPGIDAQSMVSDLLGIFGVEVTRMELVINKTYPRGKVCDDMVRNLLQEIIISDCKSIFMVRHGQVIIRNPNQGTNYGVVLSVQTGLLLLDEDEDATPITEAHNTQKSLEERSEEGARIKRKCLLNYRIGPGDIVQVQDRRFHGNLLVKAGYHEGSRRGDWITYIEGVPV